MVVLRRSCSVEEQEEEEEEEGEVSCRRRDLARKMRF